MFRNVVRSRLRSRSIPLEAREQTLEDLLTSDVPLGRRVVPLPLEGGPELGGGDEERAGLADGLEMTIESDRACAVAIAEHAPMHFGTQLAHLAALRVGG